MHRPPHTESTHAHMHTHMYIYTRACAEYTAPRALLERVAGTRQDECFTLMEAETRDTALLWHPSHTL